MLLSEENGESDSNSAARHDHGLRRLQGHASRKSGDVYDNEDQALHHDWREEDEESSCGHSSKCRERTNRVFALLRGLSWVRRSKHRGAVCGQHGAAGSAVEFAAGAVVYRRAVALDYGERSFAVGNACVKRHFDGERVVVDCSLPAALACGGEPRRAGDVFRGRSRALPAS